jgi:hypothetical protein
MSGKNFLILGFLLLEIGLIALHLFYGRPYLAPRLSDQSAPD